MRRRRFVTSIWRMIRPACRGVAMSDKNALSDMIREPARSPCQTPRNSARRPPTAPEGRSGGDLPTPPRRRKTPRRAPAGAQRPLPSLLPPTWREALRSINTPKPLEPSEPEAARLPPIRGTAPRRRQATRQGPPSAEGRPPLPRPNLLAARRRPGEPSPLAKLGTALSPRCHRLPRACPYVRSGAAPRQGLRSEDTPQGAVPRRRAQTPLPGARRSAPTAAPPPPTPGRH